MALDNPELATLHQQQPTGDGIDIATEAANDLRSRGLAQIAEDIEARIRMGEKKYGTRLRSHNGRNAMVDAYQELLDFLNYSMQGIIEGQEGSQSLFDRAVFLAQDVREILNQKS
jgi:hypothetical protein